MSKKKKTFVAVKAEDVKKVLAKKVEGKVVTPSPFIETPLEWSGERVRILRHLVNQLGHLYALNKSKKGVSDIRLLIPRGIEAVRDEILRQCFAFKHEWTGAELERILFNNGFAMNVYFAREGKYGPALNIKSLHGQRSRSEDGRRGFSATYVYNDK